MQLELTELEASYLHSLVQSQHNQIMNDLNGGGLSDAGAVALNCEHDRLGVLMRKLGDAVKSAR